MAAITTILAAASLGLAAAGTVAQITQAEAAADKQAEAQRKAEKRAADEAARAARTEEDPVKFSLGTDKASDDLLKRGKRKPTAGVGGLSAAPVGGL